MTDRRKNIYIHIGLHKTGSTTLQHFLKNNQNLLLQQGYLYPVSGLTDFGHHNLPWQLSQDKRFKNKYGIWDDLHEEIASVSIDNIVLSSEDFESLGSESIEQLSSELKPYNTKVIVYLRRQDSLIQSVYAQQVKGGFKGTFATFLHKAKTFHSKSSKRFQFDLHLHPWKEQFSLDNIIVRPLERNQLHNGDICQDFLKCIQLHVADENEFVMPKNMNKSPSHKTLEIMRYVSNILANQAGSDSLQGLEKKYLKPILKFYNKNSSDRDKFNLLTPEESNSILKLFEKSNSNVAREYLSREDGKLFYEEPENREVTSFDISQISQETQLEIMLILMNEIWKEIDNIKENYQKSDKKSKKHLKFGKHKDSR